MEPFIGMITMFGGNFAPRGWAMCNGQLLPISSNSALFSILGTTYGGDGVSTFGLPDLRGRAPVHAGQGPGLSNYALGEKTGTEAVTLTTAQIPSHTHAVQGNDEPPNAQSPRNGLLGGADIYNNRPAESAMDASAVTSTGGGQAHSNIQPVLAVNYIIALEGLYPSRN